MTARTREDDRREISTVPVMDAELVLTRGKRGETVVWQRDNSMMDLSRRWAGRLVAQFPLQLFHVSQSQCTNRGGASWAERRTHNATCCKAAACWRSLATERAVAGRSTRHQCQVGKV